jgi:polyisoprenoid-binding protein YceI
LLRALPILLLAALGGALPRAALYAETYVYRLDPKATTIRFVLDATMHKVRGTAALERGEIRFDGAGGAEGEVVVDATSLQSGNEKRDRDMHQKVLESAQFGEIVLAIDGFEGEFDPRASSRVTVNGSLRIHGSAHPLRLELDLEPRDGLLHAATTFVVPYVEWGMKNPSKAFLRVGKQVEVSIDAAGALSSAD